MPIPFFVFSLYIQDASIYSYAPLGLLSSLMSSLLHWKQHHKSWLPCHGLQFEMDVRNAMRARHLLLCLFLYCSETMLNVALKTIPSRAQKHVICLSLKMHRTCCISQWLCEWDWKTFWCHLMKSHPIHVLTMKLYGLRTMLAQDLWRELEALCHLTILYIYDNHNVMFMHTWYSSWFQE